MLWEQRTQDWSCLLHLHSHLVNGGLTTFMRAIGHPTEDLEDQEAALPASGFDLPELIRFRFTVTTCHQLFRGRVKEPTAHCTDRQRLHLEAELTLTDKR